MKLNIPLYNQTNWLNCGPAVLRMVLAYFGKELTLDAVEKEVGIRKDKAVYTIELAIAAANLGFRTKFISKSLCLDESNLALDYYKQYSQMDIQRSKNLLEEAKNKGVNLEEKTIPLKELLSLLTPKSIPIVLLDFSYILGSQEKGYIGHFLPLVGYDDKSVYAHVTASSSPPKPFFKIDKLLFDKARNAKGTDEDILVIYKDEAG